MHWTIAMAALPSQVFEEHIGNPADVHILKLEYDWSNINK